MSPIAIEYTDLTRVLIECDHPTVVLSSINFEDCSLRHSLDLLQGADVSRYLHLMPIRLESAQRASPWSALEIVKANNQECLQRAADARGVTLEHVRLRYPVEFYAAHALLERARRISPTPPTLVLDISAMPRELALYFCDVVLGIRDRFFSVTFRDVYLVVTPPARVTGRSGLGPFSVGIPRCIYQPDLLRNPNGTLKTSMLIFPGVEGFEAQACIDLLPHTEAHRTIAVDCFDPTLPGALELLIANQSVLYDTLDRAAEVQYYFSDQDALRVARETVDRAVNLAREIRTARHAFVVAPLSSKWSVAVAAIARLYYQRQCASRAADTAVCSDVLLLPRSQYVSLYSRGAGVPRAFHLSVKGN